MLHSTMAVVMPAAGAAVAGASRGSGGATGGTADVVKESMQKGAFTAVGLCIPAAA